MQRMNNEAQIPWEKVYGAPETIRERQRDTWTERCSSSQSLKDILGILDIPK